MRSRVLRLIYFNFILGFVGGKRGPYSEAALLAPPAVPSIASFPVLQDPFLQYPPPGTTM